MRYTADYQQDEDAIWVCSVREIPGCHTQAKSLKECIERTYEAIRGCQEKPDPDILLVLGDIRT